VQAGAYARTDDAEAQRAKLALLGLDARITEREQGGRTVYRVRVGPFDSREPAEDTQSRLAGAGIEANLVRVER
jgi:cell division protein FtsN